jgi:fluoride exporter
MMTAYGALAVGLGAALGAWLRWILALWLNPTFPYLPLGTLAANLIGGYMVGAAVAYFGERAGVPAEARLFLITGFLGGLTTFSTFSAETVALLARAEYGWAAGIITLHLGGSLLMTIVGMLTVKWLSRLG